MNQPPGPPAVLSGPDSGVADNTYLFALQSVEPDSDPVRYRIDWGDGDTSPWTAATLASETLSHRWYAGTFALRAQAADLSGALSDWSEPRTLAVAPGERFPDSVLAEVPIGSALLDLAAAPDGARLYVAAGNGVHRLRTNDYVLDAWLPVSLDWPSGLAVSPDGGQLYVVDAVDSAVLVVRTSDFAITDTIRVGCPADGVGSAASPDGADLYIPCGPAGIVAVVNIAARAVAASIPVSPDPVTVAFVPDGSRVLVGHGEGATSDRIEVIDTESRNVVGNPQAGEMPMAIAVAPDGSKALVSVLEVPGDENENAGFTVLCAPGFAQTGAVPTWSCGSLFRGGAVSPGGGYAYFIDEEVAWQVYAVGFGDELLLGGMSAPDTDLEGDVMACLPDGRLAVGSYGSSILVFGFSVPRPARGPAQAACTE